MYQKESYCADIVSTWVKQIKTLSKIAYSEPQAAYTAFVSGLKHRFTYHLRTIPLLQNMLQPLDDVITNTLIPAISDGHMCSTVERQLLSLPPKFGGIGIPIFMDMAQREYNNSKLFCEPLTRKIVTQEDRHIHETLQTAEIRRDIVKNREQKNKETLANVRSVMTQEQCRANDLARMKGSSSWLTTLPLESEYFTLNKREFFDALALRYRWVIKRLPSTCPCGKQFNVDHAMSCFKGGFIHQRHDAVRDMFGKIFNEVCHDVEIEPQLLPLTGENLPSNNNTSEEARLDVSARGFWQRGQRAFFDVRVFNPYAQRHLNQTLENSFLSNEREKKKAYNKRVIDVEHGCFTPLVFTPYGGCGREADRCISELSHMIAKKRDIGQSMVTNWLRTKISFALVKAAVLCLRGSRSIRKVNDINGENIEISDFVGKIC